MKIRVFLLLASLGVLSSQLGYSQLKMPVEMINQINSPFVPVCMPGFTVTVMTIEECLKGHTSAGYTPPPGLLYGSSYACIPTEELMKWCTKKGGEFELIEGYNHRLLCFVIPASEGELAVTGYEDCPSSYQRYQGNGYSCAPDTPSPCTVPADTIPIELSIPDDGYCCLGARSMVQPGPIDIPTDLKKGVQPVPLSRPTPPKKSR